MKKTAKFVSPKPFNMRLFSLLSLLILSQVFVFSQKELKGIWTEQSQLEQNTRLLKRGYLPNDFELFDLKVESMKQFLASTTSRTKSVEDHIIEIPIKDKGLERFKIYEAEIMEKELQEKYPNIRSYVGIGIDDPTARAYISVSNALGANFMILSAKHPTEYIDSYTDDLRGYIHYSRADLDGGPGFQCEVHGNHLHNSASENNTTGLRNADDGTLRTFRLALSTTGEYSTYHLNQQGVSTTAPSEDRIAAVLSAVNVAMTRVNGLFERDMAFRMVLVANTERLFYFNAGSDPFTNSDGGTLLGQNQMTIDETIGNAGYDIGHIFSTGGGGIAALNSPCVTGLKAQGVTGLPNPINDPFYVDFVAHEIGHQFGATHTQNNNCQRSGVSAMEPGSASSIMGYAGICAPNVQNNSDDHFHAISIEQMWNSYETSCAQTSATGNSAPTANAGSDFRVPVSTPLVLRGQGSDPDGDQITYNWEQMDNQVATMPPVATSTEGPLFRSISPTVSANRYLPNISTILAGNTSNTWEVIPSVTRIANFRLTVRDNALNGGSTASDDMRIIFENGAGPFEVTSQSTAETWQGNSEQMIQWNVANTDNSPVNCQLVDILFSEDGGATFTTVLEDTPNDGSQTINAPNIETTSGRIFVECSNNIFFAVNSADITIQEVLSTVEVDGNQNPFSIVPNPSDGNFKVQIDKLTNNATFEVYEASGKLIVVDSIHPADLIQSRKSYQVNLPSGIYPVRVKIDGKYYTEKLIIK